jgi:hypothetical protein
MPIFNMIASYHDADGGVYEWEGEAADYDDAVKRAQAQAFEDNHAGDDVEPYDMLDEYKGFSVMDVTHKHELRAEVAAALRDHAARLNRTRHPDITDWASEETDRLDLLARRVLSEL